MSVLEVVAAVFGAVSVWLSTRQHVASWPTALVNVLLYVIVFHRARLYADMGLQFVFAALSVYGWWEWKFGGANRTVLPVSRVPRRWWPGLALGTAAFGLGLGYLLATRTAAAAPYLDSALTATSLLAQWMMTRKYVENWLLWIAVDVLYVPLYLSRQLPATAVLYAVFLALAVRGWRDWRRDLRTRETTAAAGADR